MKRCMLYVALVGVAVSSGACRKKQVAVQNQPPKSPMAPTEPIARFNGFDDDDWPPKPKGCTNVRRLELPPELPGSLTPELRQQLEQEIPKAPQVAKALGARYALTGMGDAAPINKDGTDATRPDAPSVELRYFSYSNNAAIVVRTHGLDIQSVNREEGLEPHAGIAEVQAAYDLARKDPRIKRQVAKMDAGALLAPPRKPGALGYGHRVLYVTFADRLGETPSYSAVVDLNDGKVLKAGAAEGGTTK